MVVLAGSDGATIHSLCVLLVGAERKRAERVWLRNTVRFAEAALLNSSNPHSGTAQSNRQKESLLAEFMGHDPVMKQEP